MITERKTINVTLIRSIVCISFIVVSTGLGCGPSSESDSHSDKELPGLSWIKGDVAVALQGLHLTFITPIGIDMLQLDPQDTTAIKGKKPDDIYRYLLRKAADDLINHTIAYWSSEAASYHIVTLSDSAQKIAKEIGIPFQMKNRKWVTTAQEVAVSQSLNRSVDETKKYLSDAASDPELKWFYTSFIEGTFVNVTSTNNYCVLPKYKQINLRIEPGIKIKVDGIVGRPETLEQIYELALKEMMKKPITSQSTSP